MLYDIKLNCSGYFSYELYLAGFEYLFPQTLGVEVNNPVMYDRVRALLSPYVSPGARVTVVLPGLQPLAIVTLVAIYALSGEFPIVQTMRLAQLRAGRESAQV